MPTAETQSSFPLGPGYRLPRYELLCPIAEGGMATVWAARTREGHGAQRVVVIKTILPEFANGSQFQEMFLREGGIASRITHRNVARIFDLGEEHGVLYIAMEYVDGEALSKLHRSCKKIGVTIPPGIVLRVLADTCAGLHAAHELKDGTGRLLGIVHRDVSPPNVLINEKGVAKVIDFGIAKTHVHLGEDTDSGLLKGKIGYMAPEQALGLAVDRRTDVWAVGAVLYNLLTGKPPHEGVNRLQSLQMVTSGQPPAPLPSDVHPAIAEIARIALSPSAGDRYSTAAQMAEALENAMRASRSTATLADVAAFSARHLSDRAERRRRAIALALTGAVERRRAEDVRHAASDQTPSAVRRALAKLLPPESADRISETTLDPAFLDGARAEGQAASSRNARLYTMAALALGAAVIAVLFVFLGVPRTTDEGRSSNAPSLQPAVMTDGLGAAGGRGEGPSLALPASSDATPSRTQTGARPGDGGATARPLSPPATPPEHRVVRPDPAITGR
ncbi:MAG: serine/threonine protein kinase [Myxococcota bacterium]|nr:serine/threonine protein kinase [Myxococcota bacterium]